MIPELVFLSLFSTLHEVYNIQKNKSNYFNNDILHSLVMNTDILNIVKTNKCLLF